MTNNTNIGNFMQMIDHDLQKSGQTGILRPKKGAIKMIFIDDLHMAKPEEYNIRAPHELLRQYMDHDGWFNQDSKNFNKVQKV